MNATVIPIRPHQNTVMVQPCKDGFEIVLSTFSGYRYHLGTCEHLATARTFAAGEAFKVGRCRVQILGTEGRL